MAAKAEKKSADENPAQNVRIERIERDPAGQLIAHLEGYDEPVVDVRVARCFPWSVPDEYVSVRNCEGREIALLRSLKELDPDSRKIIEREIHDRVFNPKIKRVIECRDEFGVTSVRAETDRGEVTFQIRSRDDVRVLSPTRALFRDADGNTYELEDLDALDSTSRKHFLMYF